VAPELPDSVRARLARLALVGPGEPMSAERLTGGVSSDIWKVAAGDRVFCVKRAMANFPSDPPATRMPSRETRTLRATSLPPKSAFTKPAPPKLRSLCPLSFNLSVRKFPSTLPTMKTEPSGWALASLMIGYPPLMVASVLKFKIA